MSDNWGDIAGDLSKSVTAAPTATVSHTTSAPTSKPDLSNSRVTYPHPSFDMTSTFLPSNMKEMLKYVAVVALTDPLVSQSIQKLAEYPITDLIFDPDTDNELSDNKLKDKWKMILDENIDLRSEMQQSGMNFHAYGISVISVNYPFKRFLKCPKCGVVHSQDQAGVKFENWEFHSKCEDCGYKGSKFIAEDKLDRNFKKISIVHWDLMNLEIKFNSITNDHFFYYTVPSHIKSGLAGGDMDFVKTTRMEVIRAAQKGVKVKLSDNNLFFMKRKAPQYIFPSERGWGTSVVFSIMKEVFHNRLLKKGNEMIAFDHIVPMRIMFPQAMGEVSPHLYMDLGKWKGAVDKELQAWRKDPNHVMYAPLPLGMQQLGGDARALMVTPEIKAVEDNIIVGMGIIPEILRGGASWSGSSVSLRIVENSFLNQRSSYQRMIDFVKKNISDTYDIPEIPIKMSDFKMADDINQKQLLLKASEGSPATAVVSKTTMTQELGLDPEKEYNNRKAELQKSIELLTQEKEGFAEADGSASVINAIFQADAQAENQNRLQMRERQAIGEQQKAEQFQKEEESAGVEEEILHIASGIGIDPSNINPANVLMIITQKANKLRGANPDMYAEYLLQLKNSYPNVFTVVFNNLKELNTIKADSTPNMETVQKYTPGEVPTYTQGGISSDSESSPVEGGVDMSKQNPVQKPPQSNTPLM